MKTKEKYTFDEAAAILGVEKEILVAYFERMGIKEFAFDRDYSCDPFFISQGYLVEGAEVRTRSKSLIQLFVTKKGIKAFAEGLDRFSLAFGVIQEGAEL